MTILLFVSVLQYYIIHAVFHSLTTNCLSAAVNRFLMQLGKVLAARHIEVTVSLTASFEGFRI